MLTTDASSTKICLPGYPWVRISKKGIWTQSTYESSFHQVYNFFFFFRSTLLMLNEMDCPSYWNNKLSVRIWQLKTHGCDGRRSLAGISDILGLPLPSAWLGPERPQISHESLGPWKTPNITWVSWNTQPNWEGCVYRACHSVMSDSLQPHGLYVARQAPLSVGFSR